MTHSQNPVAPAGHQAQSSLSTHPRPSGRGAFPRVEPNSRESDERILDWLAKAERGWEPVRIAERWGVHRSTVNRTLRAFEDVLS